MRSPVHTQLWLHSEHLRMGEGGWEDRQEGGDILVINLKYVQQDTAEKQI